MFHDLPRTHVAVALLILIAMLGGIVLLMLKARRRPRPRGIRVDLVGGAGEAESDANRP